MKMATCQYMVLGGAMEMTHQTNPFFLDGCHSVAVAGPTKTCQLLHGTRFVIFECFFQLRKVRAYLSLPTDSRESESIVGCYPLDSLEVVDSEDDIDVVSRIVYYNFGYCYFLVLSVPIVAVAWLDEWHRSVTMTTYFSRPGINLKCLSKRTANIRYIKICWMWMLNTKT